MKTLALIFTACLIFSGCATATMKIGHDFDMTNVGKITKKQTTVAQLKAWFGEPYSKTTTSDGGENLLWLYSQTKSHAQSYVVKMDVSTETTGKKLTVIAKDGIVEEYSFSDGPMASPVGI